MATLVQRITDLTTAIRDKLNLMTAQYKPVSVSAIIDGGGSAITATSFVDIRFEFPCIIQGWSIYADTSGSIQFDLWKVSHANFPPNSGNTITASSKPAISNTTKGTSTVLTGWTTSVASGDIIRVRVDSVSTITKVNLTLKMVRA